MNKLQFVQSLIKAKFFKPKNKDFYYGILVRKSAEECILQDGYPIITHDGDVGRIVKFYHSIWQPGKKRWLDVKLDNKSYKHCNISSLFTLFILIPTSKRLYPLSHSCYKFIKVNDTNKLFEFRITKRNFAMLSEEIKKEREYIAILRRSRYGASFMDKLESVGFKIIKN